MEYVMENFNILIGCYPPKIWNILHVYFSTVMWNIEKKSIMKNSFDRKTEFIWKPQKLDGKRKNSMSV